jgi:peptidoglycan/LPS O-acetylase OafA/YrhL
MSAATPAAGRFAMLDGWRAVSILAVLAGHLLPLGPNRWGLNAVAATGGMAIFFTLSGFLITRFLAEGAELRVFIIRRFFRIVPLAWGLMAVALAAAVAPPALWAANLLFVSNLSDGLLVPGAEHLWSLCVEMQFYGGIALFVGLFGRRALLALPLMALAVTANRVAHGRVIDIATLYRVDEILAGGTLALAYAGWYGAWVPRLLARASAWALIPLFALSAHPALPWANYLRPYLAATLVGSTLYAPPPLLRRWFETAWMGWIATISYALYIFHGALAATWLGTGDHIVRYLKRPLLFAATFGLAHLSTYRFEQPLIARAKRLTAGRSVRVAA